MTSASPVADAIGAGTIDLTLFADGSAFHTAVLPVGGANVTNDVAIGLKTSLHVAEALKVEHGTCDLSDLDPDEVISVTVLGDEAGRTVERLDVCRIIEARMRETFEMLRTGSSPRRPACSRPPGPDRRRAQLPGRPSSGATSWRCRSGSPPRATSAASSTASWSRARRRDRPPPVGRPARRRAELATYDSAGRRLPCPRRAALRSVFP